MEKISAGIDLGTTNSCIAVIQNDKPVVMPNEQGELTTASLVSIQEGGIVVGKEARRFLLTHPANTFASMKRKMGERYSRSINGKEYSPESISAVVLEHLKNNAEKQLGSKIDDVVITVPSNFNSIQRQATKDAGEIAGLNVLRVINEPTAAALSYGAEHKLSSILTVFDLGGGTFDISVVEASDELYEVIHSHGDNHLGGDDFNMRIVNWIVREFGNQTGLDIRRDVKAMLLVHEWAIAAKHALTDSPEVQLSIQNLCEGRHFQEVLTRDMYKEMCQDLLDRLRSVARAVCQELEQPKHREAYPGVFEDSMSGCDILLVGGETRVPCVRELVSEVFRGKLRTDINPDEAVACGAAIQAGIIHRKGNFGEIILVDTTALSLGTEVKGGIFSRIIHANTPIPVTRTEGYTPVVDMQHSVNIGVFQGESELCESNVRIGEFEFLLQPPRPCSEATIQLTFHLDADDILHVSAVDKKTQASQNITIRGSQNLDRDTVDRLRREAAENMERDRDKVDRIERKNRMEAFVAEVIARVDAVAVADPQNKFVRKTREYAERLRRAIEHNNDKDIEQCARDLEAVWEKFVAALPSPAGQAAPPGAHEGTTGTSGEEQVICGNCGARLAPGLAFCGKCGVPLQKTTCVKCGAGMVEGFTFCGRCGAKVE